jgi:hypothetical protein
MLVSELDWYLRGRANERGVEPPLALVDRQDYVYYHKGALSMYALRDAVGEQRLNEALSRFFLSVASKEAPYTTAAELLEAIRPVVPEGSEYLVADLFENITMFDNEVIAATFTERGTTSSSSASMWRSTNCGPTAPGPSGRSRSTTGLTSRSSVRTRMVRTLRSSSSGDVSVPRAPPSRS